MRTRRSTTAPVRPALALAGWLALLAGTLVILHRLGASLPLPPTSPGDLGRWVETHGAVVAAAALLRLAAFAGTATLLATTTLAAGSHLAGNARAIRWTGVLLTGRQRRLVGAAVGLGLTLTSTAAAASPPPVPHAVVHPLAGASPPLRASPPVADDSPTGTDEHGPLAPGTIEVMELLAPDGAVLPGAAPPVPPSSEAPGEIEVPGQVEEPHQARHDAQRGDDTDVATDPRSAPVATWTIQPGDHLWGVAAATLSTGGADPSDAEVARYLDRLIAHNEALLVVPGNADLVYPGQVFALPDLAAS